MKHKLNLIVKLTSLLILGGLSSSFNLGWTNLMPLYAVRQANNINNTNRNQVINFAGQNDWGYVQDNYESIVNNGFWGLNDTYYNSDNRESILKNLRFFNWIPTNNSSKTSKLLNSSWNYLNLGTNLNLSTKNLLNNSIIEFNFNNGSLIKRLNSNIKHPDTNAYVYNYSNQKWQTSNVKTNLSINLNQLKNNPNGFWTTLYDGTNLGVGGSWEKINVKFKILTKMTSNYNLAFQFQFEYTWNSNGGGNQNYWINVAQIGLALV